MSTKHIMNDFKSFPTFEKWINEIYQKHVVPKPRIIFPEGTNTLIQAAAKKLSATDLLICQLVFRNRKDVPPSISNKIEILILEEENLDALAKEIHPFRAKKWTLEKTREFMNDPYYFAASRLKLNKCEGMTGGVDCSTAELIRPSIQIVGMSSQNSIVSSIFLLMKNQEKYIFTDCAMNPEPDAEQLKNIAQNALSVGIPMKLIPSQLAFLSFSTKGSGGNFPSVIKVREAQKKLMPYSQKMNFTSIGEVQFDTAFSNTIRKKKFPDNNWTSPANIYVFPDLNSANIGYKIAQEMGNFQALGPLLIGLNKPVCDLSRGAKISDIEGSALLVLLLTLHSKIEHINE